MKNCKLSEIHPSEKMYCIELKFIIEEESKAKETMSVLEDLVKISNSEITELVLSGVPKRQVMYNEMMSALMNRKEKSYIGYSEIIILLETVRDYFEVSEETHINVVSKFVESFNRFSDAIEGIPNADEAKIVFLFDELRRIIDLLKKQGKFNEDAYKEYFK